MKHDIMLHIEETLDEQQRETLRALLAQRFGIEPHAHDSSKPHLLFLPSDPLKAAPHDVLRAVQEAGYHARLVDL